MQTRDGPEKGFLTGMHIALLVSLLLSLLNRNSGADKQGRPGECGELKKRLRGWAPAAPVCTLSSFALEAAEGAWRVGPLPTAFRPSDRSAARLSRWHRHRVSLFHK
ncbi:hypothetical protein EYF80_013941 [Liparis tanakae]|uniref:Secreted protein n=1 Tax=Liparis tanakae TaxID=230148 RepID=A0A4Z2IEC7_9TELE|nr:hypothetical protein EYF80_013941 [Liparis tanakae]